MKKLTKDQEQERTELSHSLDEKRGEVEATVERFNETQRAAFEEVRAAVEAYNEAVRNAEEFRNQIESDMQGFLDAKSEKWQESEKGENYSAWVSQWSSEFYEIEIEEPDELSVPDMSHAEELADLPSDP